MRRLVLATFLAAPLAALALAACSSAVETQGTGATSTGTSNAGAGGAGAASTGGSGGSAACTEGETLPCFPGDPALVGIGACKAGTQTCAKGTLSVCASYELPTAEICNGVDDDCNGLVDDGLGTITCGEGICKVSVSACENGAPAICEPLPGNPTETCDGLDDNCDGQIDEGCDCIDGHQQPCYTGPAGTEAVGACQAGLQTCAGGQWGACQGDVTPAAESCNGVDDDCNGQVDDGLGTVSCGVGACAVTTAACQGGQPVTCTPSAPGAEICNGVDDDCNGQVDDGSALCPQAGQACVAGACVADCAAPGATPCGAGTVCNVSDTQTGACVPAGSSCVVTGPWVACGAQQCGPGALCHAQSQQCVPDLPCHDLVCTGSSCHGTTCPCARPAPTCTPAPLATLNGAAFMSGVVDLDFDLQCSAWAVTVISGPDYLRKMTPAGAMTQVTGVTNLNMSEVATLQGEGSIFGGTSVDVSLTYACCSTCGCQTNPPQGVAHFDPVANTLPMVIPSTTITTGTGPFKSVYLDTGPQGLTWGLGRQLYVGNIDGDGDFHALDLASSTKKLLTTFPSRVYAATPFDGSRLLVALANHQIRLLFLGDGTSTLFATTTTDVTSMARDPFTGRVYVSFYGGATRTFSSTGADLGLFAQGTKSGRISLARDNYLYHLNATPTGGGSVQRFPLPASY